MSAKKSNTTTAPVGLSRYATRLAARKIAEAKIPDPKPPTVKAVRPPPPPVDEVDYAPELNLVALRLAWKLVDDRLQAAVKRFPVACPWPDGRGVWTFTNREAHVATDFDGETMEHFYRLIDKVLAKVETRLNKGGPPEEVYAAFVEATLMDAKLTSYTGEIKRPPRTARITVVVSLRLRTPSNNSDIPNHDT